MSEQMERDALWRILSARDKALDEMRADAGKAGEVASARQLASRVAELEVVNQRAAAEVAAKEQVIVELHRALKGYRAAFFFVRPLLPVLRVLANVMNLFMPKLGKLYHHPPMPLALPRAVPPEPSPEWPSIALVTPSFQQAAFIERTLLSVLDQRYPRLEYFVQDGGSSDGTVDVLKRQEQRLSGWQSEADKGQSHAINLGFARTSGEIMAWLNSDDLLLPGALAQVAAYFAAHPEVDVVYGHRVLIDEQDREIGRWVLPAHDNEVLSWADFVPQETMFWRRSLWDKVGGIDENFRFAMDWDLLLRFRDAGARMVRLPHFLGAFRIHEAQKTSAAINDVGRREMALLRRRVLEREVEWREIRRAIVPYLIRHLVHDWAFRLRRRLGHYDQRV